jgi:hypothetical protein
MVEVLLANDRRLEIPYAEADRYEDLARAAVRYKKVPSGTRVRVVRSWQERKAWVVLEDLPAWMTVELAPVRVPLTLRNPTDVVEQLRGRDDFAIRQAERNRALRLVEALVRETRRRGYKVRPTPVPRRDNYGYVTPGEADRSHVVVGIGVDHYRISLTQERQRVDHTPTKYEEERAARGSWPAPRFDTVLSPHLRLTIEGHDAPFRRAYWSEKQHGPLENALAEVVQELELRHERADHQRRDAVRQQEELERQWQAAREKAIERLGEAHRVSVLTGQVEAWELVARVRAYADAMEARLGDLVEADQRAAAQAWLEWAREFAERTDPLNGRLRMPDPPRPTPEVLAPFMKGWSPHGPH